MLALLLYVLVGFGLSKIKISEEKNTRDEISIYILTNGVHTDIVMPSKTEIIDWTSKINPSHTEKANETYRYIAMGWGDKGFYLNTPTWGDLKFSTAFKAATGLSTSAMHTTYYWAMKESENCKKIEISKEQYKRLVTFITNSFEKDKDGNFIYIETDSNYGPTDAFYEAKGSYSILKTCNSWTNTALKYSGQNACLWTAMDTPIFEKYD